MRELLRSNDAVMLSWAIAVLEAEGIAAVLLDAYTSSVEGSILAIPRRLMVGEEDYVRARRILADTGAVDLSPDRPPWR
ncbi:MAG: DUF2007 domain-containing protein [Alphaproteobacteria bacterium]|nr:DUF2007 domain-containing protein [Alphaproteobacteria bacterium]